MPRNEQQRRRLSGFKKWCGERGRKEERGKIIKESSLAVVRKSLLYQLHIRKINIKKEDQTTTTTTSTTNNNNHNSSKGKKNRRERKKNTTVPGSTGRESAYFRACTRVLFGSKYFSTTGTLDLMVSAVPTDTWRATTGSRGQVSMMALRASFLSILAVPIGTLTPTYLVL